MQSPAVSEGHRVSSVKPKSRTKTYHCVYTTSLECDDGTSIPAELRIYSPFNDVVMPDNTFGYVVAKAYFPAAVPEEKALLEASRFFPFPGDPSSGAYEESIPDYVTPFVMGLGSIPAPAVTLPDGSSRAFCVVVADYVRDSRKSSTIQCVFEGVYSSRWNSTPSPSVSSCVHFFGLLAGMATDGTVSVSLESISLNVGRPDPVLSKSTQGTAKKRKLSAFAESDRHSVVPPAQAMSSSTAGSLRGSTAPSVASTSLSVSAVCSSPDLAAELPLGHPTEDKPILSPPWPALLRLLVP
ncbi:hypothetical protein EDD17DRAFT_26378 [Pisolithus thermaeus]|nr:hypothetical protein EDD17DRAFT_26378 [Pisolithus thermaeus]